MDTVRLALPAAGVLVLVVILAASHGGFAATTWYPAALTALALLVLVLLLAPRQSFERSRPTELALGAYGTFCAFSYLSIVWAQVPGEAWDAANRTLLYGVVLALVSLRPWPVPAIRWALGAVVVAASGLAIATLIASSHGDPARLFLDGRLSSPLGYPNATADLWLMGLWPALWLACAQESPWPIRAMALAAAGLLLDTAVLSQSRGAAIAFGVTAVAFVVLVPRRWPALLMFGACCGTTALGWAELTAVKNARVAGQIGPALTDGRRTIVISTCALGVLGAVWGLADRHLLERLLGRRRGLERIGNLALGALAVLVLVGALAAIGDPVSWARARYHDFKTSGYTNVDTGQSRFNGSLGSNRYDFYRVALNEFRAHPVAGTGADNFAVAYLRHRRSGETPTYAHSFAFQTLAGLGIIGAGLFLVFLALAARAVISAIRRTPGGAVAIPAALGFLMFFLHGLADWLWQFPALGVLAFALLGLSARTTAPGDRHSDASELDEASVRRYPEYAVQRWRVLARRGAVATLGLVAAVSLALPGIAARLTESAYAVSAADPTLAISRLSSAERLNFLSADAPLAEGLISQAVGDQAGAARDFRRALGREPSNWFAYLELGMVQAALGQRAVAEANVLRAEHLNPHQPVVSEVAAQVSSGRPVDPRQVEAELNAQLSAKLRPTG